MLSKTLESRLIHTSPLFLMSTTCVALFRVRFVPLAESENIFRKRVLSALSMPSFYRNWNIVIVCFMDCPLVKLRNFRDCTAARLTVCIKKTDHITPVLKKLHWLPVNDRITFKLLFLTYKSLNGLAPVYINELLYHYTPCRSLRSSDSNFLVIPKTTTITYGDRSFAAIAPKLWNQLPPAIRQSDSVDSLKRPMKTYLFR